MKNIVILIAGLILVAAPLGLFVLIGIRLWQGYRSNAAREAQRVYVITESEDVFCAPEGGLVRKDAHGAWVSFSDKEAA